MNTSQFGHERYAKGTFRLLRWEADYEFQTESSISFRLVRNSLCPIIFLQHTFGYLDVHSHVNLDGREKVILRVLLPTKYQKERLREKIVARVFDVLEIPPGTAYEACFVTTEKGRRFESQDPYVLYD